MKNANISLYRSALRTSTVLAAAAAIAAPAYAQEQADSLQEAASAETIIVTGSRIRRTDLESASPVAVVSSEEFKLTGAVNVEQLLNTLPQVIPGTTSFSNNPGGGVATLNLRGIGSVRTLVLVNGRRYVSFDTAQIVDLNTIPQFLIDGVDVVTGGASAVYGSDAIAGVVNFRLREDLEGVEIGSQYSITGKGDGGRFSLNAAIGAGFDDGRGHVTAYAEYFKRRPILQGARGFSRFALGDDGDVLSPGGSATTPQGRFSVAGTSAIGPAVGGVTPTLPRGAGNFSTAVGDGLGANFGSPGVSDIFDFPGDLYNYAPDNFLQVPQERFLLGGYGSYEINDNVTAFMEVAFVNNRVANELAPTPVTGTFNIDLAKTQPFLSAADFAALQQIDANETAINAARAANGLAPLFGPVSGGLNAQNPGIVQLGLGRRVTETGSRNSLDERNAFRVMAGFRGDIVNDFSYEAYYSYARTRNANVQAGNISRSAFRSAVENGDINIFGAGTLSQDDVDSISILAQNGDVSVLQVASGSVSGPLGNFGLGGDDIAIAVGAEWRSQSSSFIPDTALSSGDVVGFNAGQPTSGRYSVKELFGEIRVPIIADRPGFDRLEVTGAARYSDYSLDKVGGVWAYAVGAEWAPVPDITLRGQYQRAVRAPNVGELFGGLANGFPGATDPCSSRQPAAGQTATVRALCEATGVPSGDVFAASVQPNTQIEGRFGGNADLSEETSDTYTFGVVLKPRFVPGLNITVDYFDITVDNLISTFGGGLNNSLNLCYNIIQDINSPFCQAFIGARDPATGVIGGQFIPDILNANVASLETTGVDLQVDYSLPVNFGLLGEESNLNFFFLGTYTDKNNFTPVVDQPDIVNVCAGKFGNICGNPQSKYKWTARMSWLDGPLTTSVRWRHLSGVGDDDADTDFVIERISSHDLVDLSFSFDINETVTFTGGVNNLFDKKPQQIGDNQEQANTFPGVYDVLGRDFFLAVSAKF